MTKVKLKTSMGGIDANDMNYFYADGDEIEFDDATAQRLIESGQAEKVEPEPVKVARKSKPIKTE